jgi:hypothetical protein
MRSCKWPLAAAALYLLVLAAGAQAQQQQAQQPPQIGYVYPAGGKQGATFEVMVGGQFLDGASSIYLTGSGVRATVLEVLKPITQQQVGQLRERQQQLLQAPRDANTIKEIAEIRAKLTAFQRKPPPAIAETVRLQVTIAADAEAGPRELRLAAPGGLSNPRVFCVGALPEISRKPTTVAEDPNNFRGLRGFNQPTTNVPTPEITFALPAVLNGQIMPGGVDRWRFQASKGLHLVVAASARELIPYLADAVPGWFQAAITLYDAKGNELSYADHFRFQPDPVLHYEIPQDGQYVLEVRDSIYRGREDFVYRVAVGELPYVTGIFPLGGRRGEQTPVEVRGWNLPSASLTQDARDKAPGAYPFSVRKGEWLSNCVSFAVDALPQCPAAGANHTPETAQAIALPVVVNGRIGRPGEWDVYRFEGKLGQEVVAEVTARRLGSPLDSMLKLTDAGGRLLAFNDDHEDKGAGLQTHQADSYLRAKLPADGTYFVSLGDAQRQAGPEYAYRLRVSPPQSDFELRVTPASLNVRGGGSAPLTVYVLRKDGFAGEVALSLKGAPDGFTLSGGLVPAGQDQVRVTLTAPAMAAQEPRPVQLEGRARLGGQDVVRTAVPPEDQMQAIAYRHQVPSQELDVAVAGIFAPRANARVLSPTPVRIPVGGVARIQVGLPTTTPRGQLLVELSEPPDGVTVQSASATLRGTEVVLQGDSAKAKAGLKGNLIFNVVLELKPPASAPAGAPRGNQRRLALGTLPAVPFEIVELGRSARAPDGGAK